MAASARRACSGEKPKWSIRPIMRGGVELVPGVCYDVGASDKGLLLPTPDRLA